MSDDLRTRLLADAHEWELEAIQIQLNAEPHVEYDIKTLATAQLKTAGLLREAASALAVTPSEGKEKDDDLTRRDIGTPLEGLPAASTDTKGSER